ncbi:hypothetical protein HC931_00095 [Candidatus Gracilibacteria bacterium]|nr:hypothetical protein [Candidatus Gracilibacteria bacterium]NJM86009.1 hypothetical protein [Hydrococcus sp. RU_2_2]NJP17665.1 hypothetical protein [Hydrococcus sp. CRU_1_1]
MLTQFRKYYPQGSLISELVEIDHGKYIVRALVQVEGVTIATGLASSDTVEQAEDRARDRALSLLNLNEEVVIHQELTATKSQVSTDSDRLTSKERKKSTASISEIVPSQDQVEAHESLPLRSNGATSSKSKTAKITNSFTSEPQLEIQTATPEIAEPEETNSFTSEAQLEIQKATPEIAEPEETNSFTSKPQLDIQTATPEIVAPEEKDESNAVVSKTTQPALKIPSNEDTEQLDSMDIITQTTIHMKRLGWTNEQGRDYLLQTYGKRSRHLLLDEELLEFLQYLESQPTP